MNLFVARSILELDNSYSESDIKKNYRKLILRYHPDKCKDLDAKEKFTKINEAYSFILSKNKNVSFEDNIELFKKINKLFGNMDIFGKGLFSMSQDLEKKETYVLDPISITPKEYFTGVCKKVGPVNVEIPPCINLNEPYCGLYDIKIDDLQYFYGKSQNVGIYYKFDISLKESLVGFNKIFKDPFGVEHNIIVKNNIIKSNDGYSIVINKTKKLIILFNIIYPDKISIEAQEELKKIFF